MRILIIAHPRSGSTSFGKWLSMELNYQWVNEPYNNDTREWNKNKNERIYSAFNSLNVVSKFLYSDFKNESQIEETIKLFDKVILLKRNNVKESAVSILIAYETNRYHDKYKINNHWIEKNKDKIYNESLNFIRINKEISKLNGLQITYEGIYDTKEDIEKVKNYIEINEFKHLHYIDKKRRCQQNNINKKTLI
jgi:hypothetical protein